MDILQTNLQWILQEYLGEKRRRVLQKCLRAIVLHNSTCKQTHEQWHENSKLTWLIYVPLLVLTKQVSSLDLPVSKTSTFSLSTMVGMRWATVTTVQCRNSERKVCWISWSVALSTDAVASSNTRMRVCFNSARPRHTSCLWPTLQFSPFSLTVTSPFHQHWNSLLFQTQGKKKKKKKKGKTTLISSSEKNNHRNISWSRRDFQPSKNIDQKRNLVRSKFDFAVSDLIHLQNNSDRFFESFTES